MPRPGTMRFVITYDIPSTPSGDRRRGQVARYLQKIGLRVQHSVFEIEIPPEKIPRILSELQDILILTEDSIRIYPLCAACVKNIIHLGCEASSEIADIIMF